MSQRRQQISFFLTQEDEVNLTDEIRKQLPEVRLVDEWRWVDPTWPPVRESPADCGGAIGIWNTVIAPELTGVVRANGKVDGPNVGPVVQWLRCRLVDGRLNAGRWAAAYDSADKENAAYVRKLWRMLNSKTRNDLRRVSGDLSMGAIEERRFRVGNVAYRGALNGKFALVVDQLILAPE
ncbi:hypothetical protein ACWDV4_14665 [Micromonospora sp. NPDC003197]